MLHWGWNCLAILKETLPKRRFLITFESVFAAYVCVAYVLSMLLIILRKDWVWIANKGQCKRHGYLLIQRQGYKKKEGLGSLETYALIYVRARSGDKFVSYELWQFRVCLIKFKIPFLKTGKPLLSPKLGSNLFHPITEGRKNQFLKTLRLKLKSGILFVFLVPYV